MYLLTKIAFHVHVVITSYMSYVHSFTCRQLTVQLWRRESSFKKKVNLGRLISRRHVNPTSSQSRQADQFSGRARFPLSWRWRHAAAPGWTAQPQTEGRARRELRAQPFRQTVDWTGWARTEQPQNRSLSSVSFPLFLQQRLSHAHRNDIMREIVHLQAGQCGNQIGAKVWKHAHPVTVLNVRFIWLNSSLTMLMPTCRL